MAGHSKWANIKHKKARADAARGKVFTKIGREIIVAVKEGGADVNGNFRLRLAIDKARSVNMPNDNINRAVQRGLGASDGDSYEQFSYEGYGPGGVAIILDIMTDNRNRTAAEVRHLFTKYGGNMGEPGCVSWMFNRKGLILIEREEGMSEDDVMLMALESGAEDFVANDDSFEIVTETDQLENVRRSLDEQGLAIASAELTMLPQNTISLQGEEAEKALKLLNMLEDQDDVQNIYSNADISDEDMERLG